MDTIITFITAIAWIGIAFYCLRIGMVLFYPMNEANKRIIRLAEATGQNPIGDALFWALVKICVCALWIGIEALV